MIKKPTSLNNEDKFHPTATVKYLQRDAHDAEANGVALVTRLLYAVLVVGFLGYYLDKALEIIRQ